jgi:hypothetical protein
VNYSRLAIFERQNERNDVDGTGGEWEELTRAYVHLRPLTGNERLIAAQIQAHQTHAMEGHYGDLRSVRPEDRAKFARYDVVDVEEPESELNFRIFNIESSINVDEANREIKMMVVERV